MRASPLLRSCFSLSTLWSMGVSLILGLYCHADALAISDVDSSKALRSINGQWWNHEEGTYNSPTASPYVDNELRKDGRLGTPPPPPSNAKFNWPISFAWLASALYYIFVSIVVLLAIVGVVLLLMHFVRYYRPSTKEHQGSEIKIDPAKIEDLPFEAVKWSGDPLAEARKLAQQGRFDEAIVYLYGYQLLVLDQSRKIHLHKGKTNRMYIREIDLLELRSIVELTMSKFEEVFFGKHSLSKQSFLEVWTKLDDFHALAAPSIAKNAANTPASTMGVAT